LVPVKTQSGVGQAVPLESSPLYEDFMPGKDGSSSSSQDNSPQAKQQPLSEDPVPPPLTKEDWIDVLAGALQRSSQSHRERRRRSPSEEEDLHSSADSADAEDRSENSKVLGNLSTAIVESGSRQAKRPRSDAGESSKRLSAGKERARQPPKKTPGDSVANAGWKKKLLALQKAQAQLSSKVSALLDLAE